MNILIDGYNLLKQVVSNKEITPREREWFLQRASQYAHKKNHTLYIVFDGGSYARPTKEKTGTVTIIYSGYKDSADDVIKQFVEDKLLKNLLVVTTDRQLNAFADLHDIPSLDSLDFYKFMTEKDPQIPGYKKSSGQAQKLRPDEPESELDILMQEGSQILQHKREVEEEKHSVVKQTSKQEKRLLALIKKL